MGVKTTPLHIEAEWLEYQMIFSDLLERFGAQLARDVRAEKKRLERSFGPDVAPEPAATVGRKAELRSRIFGPGGPGDLARARGRTEPSFTGASSGPRRQAGRSHRSGPTRISEAVDSEGDEASYSAPSKNPGPGFFSVSPPPLTPTDRPRGPGPSGPDIPSNGSAAAATTSDEKGPSDD